MGTARSTSVNWLVVTTALCGALATSPALAQEAGAPDRAESSGDIVVTATRRAQDVTQIPYNISAVNAEQVARTGVASIEDLSRQVPNLVITSSGNQFLGAQRPIMRGLNASNASRFGVTLEQSPVSTYLGNAPYANFFQVKDIERVEVLRGPQGTLYGAGSLGGAIRLIPSQPELGKFGGRVTATAGLIDHSGDKDYGADGFINVPLGETFAVRISASHDYSGGYIDQYGVFERDGDNPLAAPKLVNPSSPLTSPAIIRTIEDANTSKATNVRAALRWKPVDDLDVTFAYNRSRINGYGPNFDTPDYNGGNDALAPSVVYPDTGEYEVVMRTRQPYFRKSDMFTLDASYDVGFATLSSTSSWFETDAETWYDGTWGTLGLPAAYLPYYTGTPANPRFNSNQRFDDSNRVFTQEVRLVSNGSGPVEFILGGFYQRERNETIWNGFGPGQTAYNALPGVTGFGPPGALDRFWKTGGVNRFTDKAIFGEMTWHVTDRFDVTGGVRVFKQSFDRDAYSANPVFGLDERGTNANEFSGQKFKLNATYEYVDDHRVYFTFSQGFRRGGANSFSLTGFLREPASILSYKPDAVDNFELGLKGRFGGGWRYSANVFLGKWKDPQIGGFTAVNFWPVVFNGSKAESKGFEIELFGKLSETLDASLGYAYTDAKLTEDFCVASGDGSGNPNGNIPCAIRGTSGTPLPSAPKHSGTFTINYDRPLTDTSSIIATFNGNFKSKTRQILPTTGQRYPINPSYWLFNTYLGYKTGPFTVAAYVRNIFDKRVVYALNTRITSYAPIDIYNTVGRPRTFGLEVSFDW